MLDHRARSRFRAAVNADDDMWLRGRGWVLYQAISALAGGWPNPAIADRARHTLRAVLDHAP